VKSTRLLALFLAVATSLAWAAEGLVAVKSPYGTKETMDRLEGTAKAKGLVVFARIDHAAAAEKIGKKLRPTELLIFGSPQGGTPFIECAQTVGIDLPLKVLVWENESGQVWLGYNDPQFIARRHEATQCPAAENLSTALAGLAREATAR
jgi:uncharacterized protein (DUF302 family)